MLIIDVIRDSTSRHEIYFLLTSYVEAVRYCDKLGSLPRPMRELPLLDADDLWDRIASLNVQLDEEAEVTDDGNLAIIRETVEIFTTAWSRLQTLDEEEDFALAKAA